MFLVLAGHEHGVGTNLKTEVGVTVSHDVVELLADYQFYTVTARDLWPDKVDADGNIDRQRRRHGRPPAATSSSSARASSGCCSSTSSAPR